jgi:hypothetical protein
LYNFETQELKALYVNQKVRRRSLAPNRYAAQANSTYPKVVDWVYGKK